MRRLIFRSVSFIFLMSVLLVRCALAQGTGAPGSGAPQPPCVTIQSITPNPFSSRTTVFYTLQTTGNLVIKLFDVKGREMATIYDGQQTKGQHTQDIDGKLLDASGNYFCRIVWGNEAPVTCNLSFEK